jgi:hypothetical protein
MSRFPKMRAVTSRGFSAWVTPDMQRYQMACCDCGLVHEMQFRAIAASPSKRGRFVYSDLSPDFFRVKFRAKRAVSATRTLRKAP